jgi:16S rRNA processing protein RimM
VGRPHGRDGSFHVHRPQHPLQPGTEVVVGGRSTRVERRAGTPERALVRLSGVEDRPAAAALHGELLLVEAELDAGEWLAGDLVGCTVKGLGTVRRVLEGPSCDLLELEDGKLVPFVVDAIRVVDTERGAIEVHLDFLGER